MKRSVAALLIGLLLIVPSTAWADYSSIPGDANADQHLTRAELSAAMLNYLENIYIAETTPIPARSIYRTPFMSTACGMVYLERSSIPPGAK